MNDMTPVIVPKSDQLNADTLLSGPITITISKVEIRPGTEQPISVRFEGDEGKPYKPCKSMARVMVHCWGADANLYVGRSMTLYCDPKVTWGGMAVGGIRISHMSDINGTMVMALTASKGNKRPFTVNPIAKTATGAKPKVTIAGWLDALEIAFANAQTADQVDEILARNDVQKAHDRLQGADKDRLQGIIDTAIKRTAGEQPPEGLFGDLSVAADAP